MENMRLEIAKVAASKSPVDTGKLQHTGRCTVLNVSPGKVTFDWYNQTHYAGFVIYGTGRGNRLKKAYNPAYEGKGRKPNLYPYLAIGEVLKRYKARLARAAGLDAINVITRDLSFLD